MSRLTGRAAMRLRAAWQIHIDAGRVKCWRCRELIEPGSTEWDLGHTGLAHVEGGDADDVAPEHRGKCNRHDGALLGNTRRRRPRRRLNEWKESPMTRADKLRTLALAFLVLIAPGLIPEPASARPTSTTTSTYQLVGKPAAGGVRYCGKLVRNPHSDPVTYRCSYKPAKRGQHR